MKKKRGFLCAAAMLLGLCPALFAGCETGSVPTTKELRVGVLSDVHIGFHSTYQQSERFEKALNFYKNKGVDAIIVAGDLQDHWTTPQYDMADQIGWIEEFTDIWFRVFPDGKNDKTGETVVPLLIYGNHDEDLCAEQYWPERFGSYSDAFLTEVKGYQFVGAHYTKEDSAIPLISKAAAQAEKDGKPFFYIQHLPLNGTVLGSSAGLKDTGNTAFDALEKCSNAVVFTGHTHIPLTDERSIWQASNKKQARFTAINTATINYSWIASYTSMSINGIPDDTQQGMYMVVDGSQITIERYSFYGEENTNGVPIGQVWRFDACDRNDRPYSYDARYELAQAPEFAEDAELEVAYIGPRFVNLLIPAARLTPPEGMSDMIHSYIVEAVDPQTGEVVATGEAATQHHIDTDASRLRGPYFVALEGLEPGKTYILNAYAREFYQKRGEPLTVQITTLEE